MKRTETTQAVFQPFLAGVVLAMSMGMSPLMAAPCAPRTGCAPRSSQAGGCKPAGCKPASCKPTGSGSAGMIAVDKVTRPQGVQPYQGAVADLLVFGEALFKDPRLSSNGMSCNTCHANHLSYAPSFARPYPHYVKMADDQSGIKKVELDEMVQFCLLSPMAGKTLPWDSKELAALTAYTAEQQKTFKPSGCAPKQGCKAASLPSTK
jgi:hypothetical protein